jgi:hypothetical protein
MENGTHHLPAMEQRLHVHLKREAAKISEAHAVLAVDVLRGDGQSIVARTSSNTPDPRWKTPSLILPRSHRLASTGSPCLRLRGLRNTPMSCTPEAKPLALRQLTRRPQPPLFRAHREVPNSSEASKSGTTSPRDESNHSLLARLGSRLRTARSSEQEGPSAREEQEGWGLLRLFTAA